MAARVVIREGEDLRQAVIRFRVSASRKFRRPWYKTRIGYYEKPSVRRRRKRLLNRRNQLLFERAGATHRMAMSLKHLHQREGGFP